MYSFLVFTQKIVAEHIKALKVSEGINSPLGISVASWKESKHSLKIQKPSSNFNTLYLLNLHPFLIYGMHFILLLLYLFTIVPDGNLHETSNSTPIGFIKY